LDIEIDQEGKTMKRDPLRWGSKIYVAVLTMLISASCSVVGIAEATPTAVPTTMPEKLKFVGGEIDPCLLVNLEEVETVLGVKVSSEARLLDYKPSCKYISKTNDRVVLLIISAVTDVSIKKASRPWLKEGDTPISTVRAYELEKMGESRMSEINGFREIDGLGDQAFLSKTTFLAISFLRNNIFYQFMGRTDYGVDFDALMKLIKIGMERMP
jgi:hypothetical protein